jgi:hypothetical protein
MSALSCDVVIVHNLGACAMRREKREKNSIRGKLDLFSIRAQAAEFPAHSLIMRSWAQLIWIEVVQVARLKSLRVARLRVVADFDLPRRDLL